MTTEGMHQERTSISIQSWNVACLFQNVKRGPLARFLVNARLAPGPLEVRLLWPSRVVPEVGLLYPCEAQ